MEIDELYIDESIPVARKGKFNPSRESIKKATEEYLKRGGVITIISDLSYNIDHAVCCWTSRPDKGIL